VSRGGSVWEAVAGGGGSLPLEEIRGEERVGKREREEGEETGLGEFLVGEERKRWGRGLVRW